MLNKLKQLYDQLIYEAQFSEGSKVPTWWKVFFILVVPSSLLFVVLLHYYDNLLGILFLIPMFIFCGFAHYAQSRHRKHKK